MFFISFRFQDIEYNKRKIFFSRNYAENVVERLVPDLFLFFKNALFELNASVCSLVSIYFDSPHLDIQ